MSPFLVVDPHPVVCQGLRGFLLHAGNGVALHSAYTVEDALNLLSKRRFKLVITGLSLLGRPGLAFLSELHRAYPEIPLLVFSSYPEEQYAGRALRAGASGYLHKSAAPSEILRAIQRVVAGEKYLSPAAAERLALDRALPVRVPCLSNREYEILEAIAGGKTLTLIARELGLSVKTISTHKRRLMAKLAVSTDAELMRYAIGADIAQPVAGPGKP